MIFTDIFITLATRLQSNFKLLILTTRTGFKYSFQKCLTRVVTRVSQYIAYHMWCAQGEKQCIHFRTLNDEIIIITQAEGMHHVILMVANKCVHLL